MNVKYVVCPLYMKCSYGSYNNKPTEGLGLQCENLVCYYITYMSAASRANVNFA